MPAGLTDHFEIPAGVVACRHTEIRNGDVRFVFRSVLKPDELFREVFMCVDQYNLLSEIRNAFALIFVIAAYFPFSMEYTRF